MPITALRALKDSNILREVSIQAAIVLRNDFISSEGHMDAYNLADRSTVYASWPDAEELACKGRVHTTSAARL